MSGGNIITHALARFRLANWVEVPFEDKSGRSNFFERVGRIVTQHAKHAARHNRGPCFVPQPRKMLNLFPGFSSGESAAYGRNVSRSIEVTELVHEPDERCKPDS